MAKNPYYTRLNALPEDGSKIDLQILVVLKQYAWLQILYVTPAFTRGYKLRCEGQSGTFTIWVPSASAADAFLACYARGTYMPCLWPDQEFELPSETPSPWLADTEETEGAS